MIEYSGKGNMTISPTKRSDRTSKDADSKVIVETFKHRIAKRKGSLII